MEITSWVERPIRRISGPGRYNPLPHAGTISVFLLATVIVSGLYITLFFQYGYEASYESVRGMEAHVIQRVIRALHRYSSAALVVTTVVHGWRIFVAGRYTVRRRRWRWLTGVATLMLLWPAGASGYLLVWDTRAGAVADAIGKTISFTGLGSAWWARHLSGTTNSSGSTFMVIVWLVHILFTVIVGYFAFRHLRRSNLAWLPARQPMMAMGGALLVVSVLLPLGMLGPADTTQVGHDVPLDPFVLFLLPILDSGWRWLALAGLSALASLVAGYAFISGRSSQPAPVTVIDEACTGCDLCVIDCPYQALSLVAGPADSMVASVDDEACTSCGICLGSCAFGALVFEPNRLGADSGTTVAQDQDLNGRSVMIACDRHEAELRAEHDADSDSQPVLRLVRCAGVVGPDLITDLAKRGAGAIDVVGCAVDDCRYGVGNTLAEERVSGARVPHIARKHQSLVSHRWVAPGELDRSLSSRMDTAGDNAGDDARGRRALIGSSALVLTSVAAIAVATSAPFSGRSEDSAVRVIVDQASNAGLDVDETFTQPVESVEVVVDGASQGLVSTSGWRGGRISVEDWVLEPGPATVEVVVSGRGRTETVFAQDVDLEPNQRLPISIRSLSLTPVAEVGRQVFFDRQTGCAVCHSIEPGENKVGPSLYGVATRAEGRMAGLDPATYLWQSILLPDEYVVDGFPAGQMLPIYRDRLTEDEIDALVAYMLTLSEDQDGTDS